VAEADRNRPTFEWVPEHDATNGDLAAQVGEDLGLPPDPDQRAILDATFAYSESARDRPAAFEVGIVAPRQNLKSSTLEVAALTDLFVMREPLQLWSSHLFKTAKATFKHMVDLIDGAPEYRRKCRRPRTATGDEAIVLTTGEEIQFAARTRGGGRGLTARKVTLDEALFLDDLHLGALLPTLATITGAQVRYASSAGMVGSAVLRGIRDRGRPGGDPALAYFEWTAERRDCASETCSHAPGATGCALDDVELWRQANPALGRRITLDTMSNLRRSMPPAEFAREFLSWWDDPPLGDGGAFDLDAWMALADPDARRAEPHAFGVDIGVDRLAHIAVAWRREDGRIQVMLTAAGGKVDTGVSPFDAARRLNALAERRGGTVWLGGTSITLAADVKRTGMVSAAEFASACGSFDDLLRARRVRHGNQPALNDAVRSARWRLVGQAGERALQLRDAPRVGPLAAAVRAIHGVLSSPRHPPPAPEMVRDRHGTFDETYPGVDGAMPSHPTDVTRMEF
jgi:hypothetical protein